MKKLNCIDLFSGAGGLSFGIQNKKIDIVMANEIVNDFAQSYILNHPKTKMINKDIHNIDFKKEIKRIGLISIDILCGGPPCQGFSTVGKKNKMDKRNSLFWEFLRAVNELEPRSILFENVSGFKGLYGGKVYDLLLKELDKIGYNVFSGVLDAANYGLPQNRKRTIVIGIEKGKSFSFPKITHNLKESFFEKKYLNIMEAISDLPNLKPYSFPSTLGIFILVSKNVITLFKFEYSTCSLVSVVKHDNEILHSFGIENLGKNIYLKLFILSNLV